MRPRLTGMVVAVFVLLAGCARFPIPEGGEAGTGAGDAPAPAAVTPPSPLLRFLATAGAEEAGTIADPVSGRPIRVIAGPRYHAASGRTCRRYHVPPGQPGATLAPGLACKDEDGRWHRSRLRINSDMGHTLGSDLGQPD